MRVKGLSDKQAGWLTRLVYRLARRKVGATPEPLTVTAHHGWVLTGMCAFEYAVEKSTRIDARIKELAQIKAASMVGCPW